MKQAEEHIIDGALFRLENGQWYVKGMDFFHKSNSSAPASCWIKCSKPKGIN